MTIRVNKPSPPGRGLGEGGPADPLLPTAPPAALHAALLAWYRRHGRDLPWRHTRDPYRILVAEVMLQQTQVERVIPRYIEFLQRFPTFESLAAATPADVIRAWAPLGYNTRAVRLREMAAQVMEHWEGHLPSDPRELRRLKGLGPYTIAALRSYSFGQPDVPLDTNQRRVLARLAGLDTATDASLRQLGEALLPEDNSYEWNQALMDLGATVCLARAPRCPDCPLREHCHFYNSSAISVDSEFACRGGPLGPPSQVQEERAPYRAGRSGGAFQGSRRQLRGRILHLLRSLPAGAALDLSTLVERLAELGLTPNPDQITQAIAGLHHDGLLQVDGSDDEPRIRLP